MKLYDLHTHTYFSHDSKNHFELSLEHALKNGVNGVAFTDHCDIVLAKEFDVAKPIFKAYDYAESIKQLYPDVEVLTGLELGESIENKFLTKQILAGRDFDVVIGSVHSVFIENPPIISGEKNNSFYVYQKANLVPYSQIDFSKMTDNEIFNYFDRYLNDVFATIKKIDIDVVAHLTCPDRYISGKFKRKLNLKLFEEKITKILLLIIERDLALEVNTSGLEVFNTLYPDSWIIKKYFALGGRKITLGSDAHTAQNVGKGFKKTITLLKKIGFTGSYYYKKRKPIFVKF